MGLLRGAMAGNRRVTQMSMEQFAGADAATAAAARQKVKAEMASLH